MTIHLMVVGERSGPDRLPNDEETDATWRIVGTDALPSPTQAFFAIRCGSPKALVQAVRAIAVEHGKIDTLDLYDHGSRGRLRMGNAYLLDYYAQPNDLSFAAPLRDLLAEHARVRLLGCETGIGEPGRWLLRTLRAALDGNGRVVVYGSLCAIENDVFDANGFLRKYFEEQYLVSSTEVEHQVARSYDDRSDERAEWERFQRVLLGNCATNPDPKI